MASSSPPSILERPPSTQPPLSTLNWKSLLSFLALKSNSYNLSYIHSSEETVSFSVEEITDGLQQWNKAQVGYALGRQPSYDNLLQAIKKVWNMHGSSLTLIGGFSSQKGITELQVVGGTGGFRSAQGFGVARTLSSYMPDIVTFGLEVVALSK